jgi:hypothetical protein
MTEVASFHDLVITVRVKVTDRTAVLSHPCAMYLWTGADDETTVYVPGSVEEAVVARFTALLDHMYQTCDGLEVCEHSEYLTAWQRHPPQ